MIWFLEILNHQKIRGKGFKKNKSADFYIWIVFLCVAKNVEGQLKICNKFG